MSIADADTQILNFKISSQLKSIIGKDLITDDHVAIFELVKNSFDAKSQNVILYFAENEIHIVDDGKGLTYEDLVHKWLFVAYSAKNDGSEDSGSTENDYRNDLSVSRHYAGSKGVGRFSCDRLGSRLILQSRSAKDLGSVNSLDVDWTEFERSLTDEFVNIPVRHTSSKDFVKPDWVISPSSSGTMLSITGLRQPWNRSKLLDLKRSLAKLIDPFGRNRESFKITIIAPLEELEDKKFSSQNIDDPAPNSFVNGVVENFIFQVLEEKTTWLRTWIDHGAKKLYTELNDRGALIYRISEEAPYASLLDSNFECNLFYLNRSAKATFSRRMGLPSVNFGSIFLFKNGFRVYPLGEPSDDSFGIDARKQQGYARFLGTRDIVGRIDVKGDETKFKESSSRDKGLIETVAAHELRDCFWKKCFLRLENYVVGVSWVLKFDMDIEDSSFLNGDEAKATVISVLAKLANSPAITVETYAKDLLSIVSNKVSEHSRVFKDLESLATKVGDVELANSANEAVQKFLEMERAEASAVAYAERERANRKEAEQKEKLATVAFEKEQQKNLFLTSLQSHDKEILENLHHQVIIYASNAINSIEANLIMLRNGANLKREEFQELLENLLLLNQQVLAASRFATTANFRMESNTIREDLGGYVQQYLERVCPIYENRITVEVKRSVSNFVIDFKPIEISIILDNLIDNAYKAGATKIEFNIRRLESNILQIEARDNGMGLDPTIQIEESIFEKGVTTTSGSGLGLYHVRQLLEKLKGVITLGDSSISGTVFNIKIYK
ncbi:sensor histidine kinase [Undibacterium fentianense]|uniref:histidine kinase n=1 Tax=Undibacterium fentianense TaxID=2828728 RepID=A0A941E5R1_9BURK|nr:sensor histidine kinase [Undibacterium fentianense]MBR7801446.1 ATP-binding protein [Undibacterium fentianense]